MKNSNTLEYISSGQIARKVIARYIDPKIPVAILDYPDHSNVGDSAIWAGEDAFIRELKCDVRYTCDVFNFSESALRSRMPYGQIVLHGGGNFGSLWPIFQAFREMILLRFPEYRVIQMPQSIHFEDDLSLQRTKRCMEKHPNFVFLARDRESHELASRQLGLFSELCPDSAMILEGTLKRRPAEIDVLVLARTDKEVNGKGLSGFALPGKSVQVVDWIDEPGSLLRSATKVIKSVTHGATGSTDLAQRIQRRVFRNLANERVSRGGDLLSRGRVVVTDRLHAHILCTLLGIPHVVLDNNYGKISRFIQCWHPNNDLCVSVKDLGQAISAAEMLLK